eukprot:g54055.t1
MTLGLEQGFAQPNQAQLTIQPITKLCTMIINHLKSKGARTVTRGRVGLVTFCSNNGLKRKHKTPFRFRFLSMLHPTPTSSQPWQVLSYSTVTAGVTCRAR